MAYTKYSLTPADNNAAPPNGAPEGMLPSGVNDTMRDMMAQIRDVGDGIRGGTYTMTAPVITGGSVTGVTFSSGTATITGGSVSGITDLAIADGGTGASTAADARVNLGVDNYGSMKNRIINGAMVIDARNAGASVTPTASEYTLDRWRAGLSVSSKFSVEQTISGVSAPAGFTDYLGVTSLSAYSVGASEVFVISQAIEGYNVADLAFGTANAKTITLSFWVRSSLTGTFGGALANSGATRSYPFTYTISSANTWEQKSITIAGDTSGTWLTTNGLGLSVVFGLGVGSTLSGTAGAWAGADYRSATGATSVVGTNGATFYITGCQLEVGSQATSFEYRQYQQELALCQRYYEKSFPQSVAVATNAGTVGSIRIPQLVAASSAQGGFLMVEYKVTKRTDPTVTIYNPSAANNQARNLSASVDCSVSTVIGDSDDGRLSINFTTGAGTGVNQVIGYQYSSDAEL